MDQRQQCLHIRHKIDVYLDGLCLTPLGRAAAWHTIEKMVEDSKNDYARVRAHLLSQLNRSAPRYLGSKWQRGCPDIMAGLTAKAFWDLPQWAVDFQSATEVIRNELAGLRIPASSGAGFQPYRCPAAPDTAAASGCPSPAAEGIGTIAHESGDWNVAYLFLPGLDALYQENRRSCKETVAALEAVPRSYGKAFFSALAAGTHVLPHCGPNNRKLRLMLPLTVPKGGSRIRVGNCWRQLEAGKAILFDDSFEHEAWNDDEIEPRVSLVVDIHHPDLSEKEVRWLQFLQKAESRMIIAAGRDNLHLLQDGKGSASDFATVIRSAQRLALQTRPPETSIWPQQLLKSD